MMQTQPFFYPVKIVTHSAKRKRNKWLAGFVAAGMVFSLACLSALSPSLSPEQMMQTAMQIPAISKPAIELLKFAARVKPVQLEDIIANAPNYQAEAQPGVVYAPEKRPISYPLALDLKVQEGDTLVGMLTEIGISPEEATAVVAAAQKIYDPKHLDVGKNLTLQLNKDAELGTSPSIRTLSLPISPISRLEIIRADNGFQVQKIDAKVERRLAHAGGSIESSLYQTGIDSGIPPALLSEIINAYSYDVDFQREIQPGDSLDVLFERMQTEDGVIAGHGNIIFANLDLGDRALHIYRFIDREGHVDYYNEKGESVRKALLRTPINGAKITSGYGMRMHPLLGYSKMHRGVDFGAPTGTPIYAAGDGVVEYAATKGGYGNYLRLRHNNQYSSAYGHISRFASNIRPGIRVRQGQIIAYVGATGMATGPHLHYEILSGGEQVNPSGVKFKNGNVLTGKELAAFHKTVESVQARLASTPRNAKTTVAMANDPQANAY